MYSTRRWLRDTEASEVFAQDVFPTHPNISLTTEYEILVVFEAVRQGKLPLIYRHLNERESVSLVRPNAAFVFEEQGHIKRWTDGRAWSGTHRFGRVFMYFELDGVLMYESRKNGGPRARGQADDKAGRSRNRGLPPKVGGLHKYSYSALIFDPDHPNHPRRRYHITWYKSSTEDDSSALTIYDDAILREIIIPPNVWVGTDETPLPSAQSGIAFGDRTPVASLSPMNSPPTSPPNSLPTSPIGNSPVYRAGPSRSARPPPSAPMNSSAGGSSAVTLPSTITFPSGPIFPSLSPVKGPTALPSFTEVLGRTGAPSTCTSRPGTASGSQASTSPGAAYPPFTR